MSKVIACFLSFHWCQYNSLIIDTVYHKVMQIGMGINRMSHLLDTESISAAHYISVKLVLKRKKQISL